MRIGMFSMDYPPRMAGGTTVHTYSMATTFAKMGHRPIVIAAAHPSAPEHEISQGVEIHRVRRPYTLFSALKGRAIMKDMDVVHGHGTCTYGFMRIARFPTVVKMHSTWLAEYRRYRSMGRRTGMMRLYVHMDRYCARHASAVIAISEVIKRETMEYGVPEDRITVIHNGIDASLFSSARPLREELGIPQGAIVIGYIGRLAPHKGVMALAESFLNLARRHSDLYLLVVGDGTERENMAAILSSVKDRVIFTGYVPHDSVPSYYATADIIVYPTTYEPLGNVVLEAMASGKPLVASRVGGIPEIFSSRAGILIPPPSGGKEHTALTEALEELIADDGLRREMGRAGREEVKKYSWEKVCEKTLEVLESVLRA